MNEVDEDNNVVGDQPFLGMTVSKKNSTLQNVRSVLSFILTVAILAICVYGLYILYKWYKNKKPATGVKKQKAIDKKAKKSNASSFGFGVFTDEETAVTENTGNHSKSIGNMLGFKSATPPPEPVKKTFGQKVKGLFSKKDAAQSQH